MLAGLPGTPPYVEISANRNGISGIGDYGVAKIFHLLGLRVKSSF